MMFVSSTSSRSGRLEKDKDQILVGQPQGRLISLTERVLLNRYVLDWIYPSNCPMQKVQSVGESVIKSFTEMQQNPFINSKNETFAHRALKPIRAVMRTVTVIGTTTLLSPIGALYYGSMTGGLLAAKGANWVANRLNIKRPLLKAYDPDWKKIKAYAKVFLPI